MSKIPVKAEFHGYSIETTVDDDSARFYLEEYLAGKRVSSAYSARTESLSAEFGNRLPVRDDLKKISEEFSVDFAALFFAHQLMQQRGNDRLQTTFRKNLEKVRSANASFPKKDILILIVPGYDYAANGHLTGADFARPRKLLQESGYRVHFVDIDPLGSVEENAEYLSQTIRRLPREKIALAGASSAGPAIHLALGKLLNAEESRNIKAWLNLGGILQGSPLLDQFSHGPKGWLFSTIIWFKGWKKYPFLSMSARLSRERFQTLSVPQHITIYNYLGLSLSGDISRFGRDKYALMRSDGPNDGLTLLPDIIAPNSYSILSPKTDHFFAEDPEMDKKTLALLLTVIEKM